MERVTDLYPETRFRTRVLITDVGRKELEKCVHEDVAALFESRAAKGFQDYLAPALRHEGDQVWAFGTQGHTSRICGFFLENRNIFVVTGAWKGKRGRGNARPPHADAVVDRTKRIRRYGIQFP